MPHVFKKAVLVTVLCLVLLYPSYGDKFTSKRVVDKIEKHAVAISVIYSMDEDEYNRRATEKIRGVKVPLSSPETPIKCIAYLGAGTVIRDNCIVSVNHLFSHGENTIDTKIWVFLKDHTKAYEASLIAISDGYEFHDDYALIETKENLGLSGIKLAKRPIKKGEKVIFVGSTGGSAFLARFGYLTTFKYFFQRGEDGKLHLSFWEDYEYLCVLPGAPGDSGGGMFNDKGELIGIMYCGINIYGTHYIFSNPLSMLKDFLKDKGFRRLYDDRINSSISDTDTR